MITPSGDPAWVRTASFSNYGGSTTKHDYMGIGAIDPYTDLAASEFSRMVSDMAACARTAPFAVITYVCTDSGAGEPSVEAVYMMTAVTTVSYLGEHGPVGFPSIARNGNGDVTVTFASSYNDEYAVAGAFAIRHANGSAHATGGVHRVVTTEIVTSTTLRVRVFDDAGVAVSDPRVTVLVF